jgi:DNA-binding response OmpR family regulator
VDPSPRKKKTVLVAEDNACMREALRIVLEYGGFQVALCPDCGTAIKRTGGESFDIFIVDYFMPDCSGLVVTKRARECCPRSFIIGMSMEDRRQEFLKAGADEFLPKPVDIGSLLRIIDKEE